MAIHTSILIITIIVAVMVTVRGSCKSVFWVDDFSCRIFHLVHMLCYDIWALLQTCFTSTCTSYPCIVCFTSLYACRKTWTHWAWKLHECRWKTQPSGTKSHGLILKLNESCNACYYTFHCFSSSLIGILLYQLSSYSRCLLSGSRLQYY